MKLTRFLKGLVFLTATALIYLHLQMSIFDLAYQGKVKEYEIQKLKDDNGVVTYQILKLKSASHLGDQMLDEKSGLQFVGREQIIEVNPGQKNLPGQKSSVATEGRALALATVEKKIVPSAR